MKRYTKILVSILALFVTCIIGSNQVFALTYQDELDVSFTFNSSISMSLSSGNLVISSLSPDTYADSNIVTITTSTNNSSGYTLTATAGDGDTYTNTNLIDSTNTFTSLGTSDSIGSMSSANATQNGRWGYAFSTDSGTTWRNATGGTGYSGLPYYTATGAQIVDSSTNGTSSVQFKIGAKANAAQSAGTYRNVINFVAITNPEPAPTMQEFATGTASTTCSTMSVGDTLTLADSRDDQEYTIGKLADGKCWMLDNLALDLVAKKNNLNENNTNASNATLGYLKNGGGSGQYTGTAVAYAGSSNAYNTPLIAVSGSCNDAYCVNDPTSGQWTSSSVTQETINGVTSIAQGKIGAYYNYCAASAGSYCYASESGTGNVSEDICPAGWRLPTGGSSGEFDSLLSQYRGGSPSQMVAFQTALATPLSGYFGGTARNQGNHGYFWSSTYYNDDDMYSLRVSSSSAGPSYSNARSNSLSVRCLLSS